LAKPFIDIRNKTRPIKLRIDKPSARYKTPGTNLSKTATMLTIGEITVPIIINVEAARAIDLLDTNDITFTLKPI
jgi:hypothetical protein